MPSDEGTDRRSELKNEHGAAILEVPCPYKNCSAGKGAECRTKRHYAMVNGVKELVKGGNERDSVHYVRYKKAVESGVLPGDSNMESDQDE